MQNKRKPKLVRPDEVFSRGHFTMARFGKNILFQSNWPKDKFAEMQQRFVQEYPNCVNEINKLVIEIADLVKTLPADELLHRAWWVMAGNLVTIKSESELNSEDVVSLRMVDYIQSVIASVEPAEKQANEVSDEDWKALMEKVDVLFQRANLDYQICLSAKRRAEDPHFDLQFEEFKVKASMHWCNVRGNSISDVARITS